MRPVAAATGVISSNAVATAHPLATQVAMRILRSGGSAIDAAIAAQAVLTLVEPQSSGIGGGAFLMHHDGRHTQAFDGRETAPAAATEDMFLRQGQPMPFAEAAHGGLGVGVPGVMRMLEMVHRQHGRLPWADLFAPAITLSESGFPISPRLAKQIAADSRLGLDSRARAYFLKADGTPREAGDVLRNPALADIFRHIAREGASAMHQGPIADAIVKSVRGHPLRPGRLDHGDLATFQPRERKPLCFPHRAPVLMELLTICGLPPPGSGTIAVGQILGIMHRTASAEARGPDEAWRHHYAEASRLAYADRARFIGDEDFITPPGGHWLTLLDPGYLDQRAQRIGQSRMPSAPAGQPAPDIHKRGMMPLQAETGTSHMSIADRFGNSLAMTSTIEGAFGAAVMVGLDGEGGFLLNHQLTDFSFQPRSADGLAIANRVQPGKRPRSSMTPLLVMKSGTNGQTTVHAIVGSPGGAAIIHYTAKTLFGILHWGMSPQEATAIPHLVVLSPEGPVQLEARAAPADWTQGLRSRQHDVRETELQSGIQLLLRVADRWQGGADPRREGSVDIE